MSEKESNQSSVNLKRRRLVKGLAGAAPGVFTLYSGNAFALASATQRCIIEGRYNFDETSVLASENFFTDQYQRGTLAEVAIEVKKASATNTRWLAPIPSVTTGDIHWFEVDVATWGNFGTQEWKRCADVGGSGKLSFAEPFTSCPVSGSGAPQQGPWTQTNTDGVEAHALFCVDDHGEVVSAYPEECGTLTPVNRSCWASIDPGAPDPTTRGDWW